MCIFVSKISRQEVDRLSRQPAIGDDMNRYPPRAFLEVKSPTFTSSSVVLKGLKNCCFTVTSPLHPNVCPAVQQQGKLRVWHYILKHAHVPTIDSLDRKSVVRERV